LPPYKIRADSPIDNPARFGGDLDLDQCVMTKSIDISVIVCTRNRAKDIANLLESLCSQSRLPDELIIVDASDNRDTKDLLKQRRDQVPFDLVYKNTAPGLTRQRNIGINFSRGNYIFFFDDDTIVEDEFVETVYKSFSEFEKFNVAGIMGRIANIPVPKKSREWMFKKIFLLSDFGKGKVKLSGLPSIRIDEVLCFVESLPGGCTAYKREVFDDYRFDEKLKGYAYLEDVDFSYRVGKKYCLLYQPKARLSHFPSTYLLADSKKLRKMFVQHHTYLFKKNMPKDIPHYLGYWISIVGSLLYNGFIQKDMRACMGIIEGLLEPLPC
jgi:GT2 family glycosyltransferase